MWKPITKAIDKLHDKYGTKVIKTENVIHDVCIASTTISSIEKEEYYIDRIKEELVHKLANDLLDKGYIKFSRYSLDGYVVCDSIYEPSNRDEQDILIARLDVIRRRDND